MVSYQVILPQTNNKKDVFKKTNCCPVSTLYCMVLKPLLPEVSVNIHFVIQNIYMISI